MLDRKKVRWTRHLAPQPLCHSSTHRQGENNLLRMSRFGLGVILVTAVALGLLATDARAQPRMKARPIIDAGLEGESSMTSETSKTDDDKPVIEMMPEVPPRPMIEVLADGYIKNTGYKRFVQVTTPFEEFASDSPFGLGQQSYLVTGLRTPLTVTGEPTEYRFMGPFDGHDMAMTKHLGVMNKSISFWFWTDDEMPSGLCGQEVSQNQHNKLYIRTYPEDDFISVHIGANVELATRVERGELLSKWVHVAATFHSNLTRLSLYVNGRKEKTVSGIDPIDAWWGNFPYLFGNSADGNLGMAAGSKLAWIRMFDAELTMEQVAWLYNERLTGAKKIPEEYLVDRYDKVRPKQEQQAQPHTDSIPRTQTTPNTPAPIATATDTNEGTTAATANSDAVSSTSTVTTASKQDEL